MKALVLLTFITLGTLGSDVEPNRRFTNGHGGNQFFHAEQQYLERKHQQKHKLSTTTVKTTAEPEIDNNIAENVRKYNIAQSDKSSEKNAETTKVRNDVRRNDNELRRIGSSSSEEYSLDNSDAVKPENKILPAHQESTEVSQRGGERYKPRIRIKNGTRRRPSSEDNVSQNSFSKRTSFGGSTTKRRMSPSARSNSEENESVRNSSKRRISLPARRSNEQNRELSANIKSSEEQVETKNSSDSVASVQHRRIRPSNRRRSSERNQQSNSKESAEEVLGQINLTFNNATKVITANVTESKRRIRYNRRNNQRQHKRHQVKNNVNQVTTEATKLIPAKDENKDKEVQLLSYLLSLNKESNNDQKTNGSSENNKVDEKNAPNTKSSKQKTDHKHNENEAKSEENLAGTTKPTVKKFSIEDRVFDVANRDTKGETTPKSTTLNNDPASLKRGTIKHLNQAESTSKKSEILGETAKETEIIAEDNRNIITTPRVMNIIDADKRNQEQEISAKLATHKIINNDKIIDAAKQETVTLYTKNRITDDDQDVEETVLYKSPINIEDDKHIKARNLSGVISKDVAKLLNEANIVNKELHEKQSETKEALQTTEGNKKGNVETVKSVNIGDIVKTKDEDVKKIREDVKDKQDQLSKTVEKTTTMKTEDTTKETKAASIKNAETIKEERNGILVKPIELKEESKRNEEEESKRTEIKNPNEQSITTVKSKEEAKLLQNKDDIESVKTTNNKSNHENKQEDIIKSTTVKNGNTNDKIQDKPNDKKEIKQDNVTQSGTKNKPDDKLKTEILRTIQAKDDDSKLIVGSAMKAIKALYKNTENDFKELLSPINNNSRKNNGLRISNRKSITTEAPKVRDKLLKTVTSVVTVENDAKTEDKDKISSRIGNRKSRTTVAPKVNDKAKEIPSSANAEVNATLISTNTDDKGLRISNRRLVTTVTPKLNNKLVKEVSSNLNTETDAKSVPTNTEDKNKRGQRIRNRTLVANVTPNVIDKHIKEEDSVSVNVDDVAKPVLNNSENKDKIRPRIGHTILAANVTPKVNNKVTENKNSSSANSNTVLISTEDSDKIKMNLPKMLKARRTKTHESTTHHSTTRRRAPLNSTSIEDRKLPSSEDDDQSVFNRRRYAEFRRKNWENHYYKNFRRMPTKDVDDLGTAESSKVANVLKKRSYSEESKEIYESVRRIQESEELGGVNVEETNADADTIKPKYNEEPPTSKKENDMEGKSLKELSMSTELQEHKNETDSKLPQDMPTKLEEHKNETDANLVQDKSTKLEELANGTETNIAQDTSTKLQKHENKTDTNLPQDNGDLSLKVNKNDDTSDVQKGPSNTNIETQTVTTPTNMQNKNAVIETMATQFNDTTTKLNEDITQANHVSFKKHNVEVKSTTEVNVDAIPKITDDKKESSNAKNATDNKPILKSEPVKDTLDAAESLMLETTEERPSNYESAVEISTENTPRLKITSGRPIEINPHSLHEDDSPQKTTLSSGRPANINPQHFNTQETETPQKRPTRTLTVYTRDIYKLNSPHYGEGFSKHKKVASFKPQNRDEEQNGQNDVEDEESVKFKVTEQSDNEESASLKQIQAVTIKPKRRLTVYTRPPPIKIEEYVEYKKPLPSEEIKLVPIKNHGNKFEDSVRKTTEETLSITEKIQVKPNVGENKGDLVTIKGRINETTITGSSQQSKVVLPLPYKHKNRDETNEQAKLKKPLRFPSLLANRKIPIIDFNKTLSALVINNEFEEAFKQEKNSTGPKKSNLFTRRVTNGKIVTVYSKTTELPNTRTTKNIRNTFKNKGTLNAEIIETSTLKKNLNVGKGNDSAIIRIEEVTKANDALFKNTYGDENATIDESKTVEDNENKLKDSVAENTHKVEEVKVPIKESAKKHPYRINFAERKRHQNQIYNGNKRIQLANNNPIFKRKADVPQVTPKVKPNEEIRRNLYVPRVNPNLMKMRQPVKVHEDAKTLKSHQPVELEESANGVNNNVVKRRIDGPGVTNSVNLRIRRPILKNVFKAQKEESVKHASNVNNVNGKEEGPKIEEELQNNGKENVNVIVAKNDNFNGDKTGELFKSVLIINGDRVEETTKHILIINNDLAKKNKTYYFWLKPMDPQHIEEMKNMEGKYTKKEINRQDTGVEEMVNDGVKDDVTQNGEKSKSSPQQHVEIKTSLETQSSEKTAKNESNQRVLYESPARNQNFILKMKKMAVKNTTTTISPLTSMKLKRELYTRRPVLKKVIVTSSTLVPYYERFFNNTKLLNAQTTTTTPRTFKDTLRNQERGELPFLQKFRRQT